MQRLIHLQIGEYQVDGNRLGEIQKINRASSEFEQQMEREPTDEELAELLNENAVEENIEDEFHYRPDPTEHHVAGRSKLCRFYRTNRK